jgi:hypothetical protein
VRFREVAGLRYAARSKAFRCNGCECGLMEKLPCAVTRLSAFSLERSGMAAPANDQRRSVQFFGFDAMKPEFLAYTVFLRSGADS